ncbi:hypothetical protein ACFQS1_17680 [Paractinoplanes rhizophilus]|jgi:hypothetical protein|uniref:Secreted protein n=1 Tax=Paractinoplanes rhizophilus TaxID=1416877 RepID=A0ABW2HSM7_9ACTN|nr:hypothetical protein [Actinoplanes sp.]
MVARALVVPLLAALVAPPSATATSAAMSSLLCAAAAAPRNAGRTVWFDRGDNRPAGNPGGDFPTGR